MKVLAVFSLMNDSHFVCHALSASVNAFSFVLVSVSTSANNSFPASVLGLVVMYRMTILIWWNWHICTGIPLKTLNNPLLPSTTAAVNDQPFVSSIFLA